MNTIQERIVEIKKRCDAALPNWVGTSWLNTHAISATDLDGSSVVVLESPEESAQPSQEIILALSARTDLPALAQALEVAVAAMNECAYPNYCGGESHHLLSIITTRQGAARIALQEIERLLGGTKNE